MDCVVETLAAVSGGDLSARAPRSLPADDVGIEQALRMFDAMSRIAEIDAGHARSRFVTINLVEIAERVADAYRPEIEASDRRLDVVAPAGMLVTGDADLVTQALANIVENSLKHDSGGTARSCRQ